MQAGDYVDFGAYGKLYVVKLKSGLLVSEGTLWVTDQEEDRFNDDARGWYIEARYAEKIIQSADEVDRDDYNKEDEEEEDDE
jgi:hypothetical protein